MATRSLFLSLPPELRNRVYIQLLHSTEPIRPDPVGIQEFYRRPGPTFDAGCALIQTCKLIAVEATAVLYRSNVFKFSDQTSFPTMDSDREGQVCDVLGIYIFLSTIGLDNRTKIRHLVIEIYAIGIFTTEGLIYNDKKTIKCGRQF